MQNPVRAIGVSGGTGAAFRVQPPVSDPGGMGDNNMGNLLLESCRASRNGLDHSARVDYSDFTFAQYVSTRSMKVNAWVPGSKPGEDL
ncbi:MAG: hypothetical protein Ct9H300mP14_07590 [Gammaproteobacteria bacterium]|nr:MAG: hypothetical protein Ct9H300mP14_07590 [Gammaproteobacteria bacterium]